MGRSWNIGPIARAARRQRLAAAAVIIQVAIGLAIVALTAQVGRYILREWIMPTGMALPELVIVEVRAPVAAGAATRAADLAAIRAVPGVAAATTVDGVPLGWSDRYTDTLVADGTPPIGAWEIGGEGPLAATLGVTLVAGTDLDVAPRDGVVPAIVSQRIAGLLAPGGSAIGREFQSRSHGRARVVGVARTLILKPFSDPEADLNVLYGSPMPTGTKTRYVVRTAKTRSAVVGQVAATLAALDAARSVRAAPADAVLYELERSGRNAVVLITVLVMYIIDRNTAGACALTAFLVEERTRQIGLRRALGARRRDVMRLFLVENLLFTTTGIVLGIGLVFAITPVFATPLPGFGVSAWDLAGASLLFLVTGLVATYVPARRATRIPPSVASRAV